MLYALTCRARCAPPRSAAVAAGLTLADAHGARGHGGRRGRGRRRARWAASSSSCGKGNNGGDGWVAARELHAAGRDVARARARVARRARLARRARPPRRRSRSACRGRGRRPTPSSSPRSAGAALIVDAVFGFGFHGPAREPYARALEAIDDADAAVLAVDVPSGVDTDTGAVAGRRRARGRDAHVHGAEGRASSQYPGAEYAGEVLVADIGVPRELRRRGAARRAARRGGLPRPRSRCTPPDAHKNTRGRVLVVAGSRGMTGAAALAVRGGAAHRRGLRHARVRRLARSRRSRAKLTPVVHRARCPSPLRRARRRRRPTRCSRSPRAPTPSSSAPG